MTRDERGLSSSVQAALLFPLIILPLLAALQWSMLAWADATIQAAAQDGARQGAALGSNGSAGEATARAAADNGAVTAIRVTVSRGATTTTATVSGQALRVVPLWPTDVSVTASAPTQRITNS